MFDRWRRNSVKMLLYVAVVMTVFHFVTVSKPIISESFTEGNNATGYHNDEGVNYTGVSSVADEVLNTYVKGMSPANLSHGSRLGLSSAPEEWETAARDMSANVSAHELADGSFDGDIQKQSLNSGFAFSLPRLDPNFSLIEEAILNCQDSSDGSGSFWIEDKYWQQENEDFSSSPVGNFSNDFYSDEYYDYDYFEGTEMTVNDTLENNNNPRTNVTRRTSHTEMSDGHLNTIDKTDTRNLSPNILNATNAISNAPQILPFSPYGFGDSENEVSFSLENFLAQNKSFPQYVLFLERNICGETSCRLNSTRTCNHFKCGKCQCKGCETYGDCCVEEVYREHYTRPSISKHDYMGCLSTASDNSREHPYFLINRCPNGWYNTDIIAKCETIPRMHHSPLVTMDTTPVYSPFSFLNYVNRFCAMCHNDTSGIEPWTSTFKCADYIDTSAFSTQEELLQYISEESNCSTVHFPPKSAVFRSCVFDLEVVSTCNVTGNWQEYNPTHVRDIEQACHTHGTTVSIFSTRYANIFCALCNGISTDLVETLLKVPTSCFVDTGSFSFSIIFNFKDSKTHSVEDDIVSECPKDEIYHSERGACRPLVCTRGKVIDGHACVDAYHSARGVGYRVSYRLVPGRVPHTFSGTFKYMWDKFSSFFRSQTRNVRTKLKPLFHRLSLRIGYQGNHEGNLNKHQITDAEVEFVVVVGLDLKPEIVEMDLQALLNVSWCFDNDIWSSSYENPTTLKNDSEPLLENVNYKTEYRNNEFKGVIPDMYLKGSSAYIDVNKFTRCSQIQLSRDEYTSDSTGGIHLSWSNQIIRPSDYIIVNGTIRFCANYSGYFISHKKEFSTVGVTFADNLLSLISVSLSLIGLGLTVIICFVTNIRKTLPGKLTIILVLTLFVAQLLLLISGYASGSLWGCRLLGLAVHYFWLAVFTWKNITAYHMYAVFNKPFSHTSERQLRTMLSYSVYGFGFPGLIVATYVSARALQSDSETIGYGGRSCFLSRPIDIALAFALPVGLALLSNAFFFTHAVRAISRMSEFEKNSNRANTSQNSLFIRMTIALGFTWVFGFLANIISKPFMWYIFIVLNGGSGVFIFLSQVCNKRFVGLVREHLGLKYGLSSTKSGQAVSKPVTPSNGRSGDTA